MKNELKYLVREQVIDLLKEIDIHTEDVKNDGRKWARTSGLGNYFGISKSNLSHRNCKDFPDAFTQIPPQERGKWYIQIEFIPWVVFKSVSNHTGDPSSKFHKRKIDFLSRIGISVPKSQWYIYFIQSEDTRYITIGRTANYLSGSRFEKIERDHGPCLELASHPTNDPVGAEKRLHSFFKHLRVEGKKKDWFRPGETLMGYIEAVKNSTSST